MKIVAENIDSKFWNIEYLAVDILKSIELTGSVTLHFKHEGPAFLETNLYKLFEYMKDRHSVDLSKITILTGNVIEDISQEYKVVIEPSWMYELESIQKIELENKKLTNAKTFGVLIGRSNYARLMIAGHVFANFLDDSFLTFHYDSQNDSHRGVLGLEELINFFGINSDIVLNSLNLLKNSPVKKNSVSYPIFHPESYTGTLPWYNNFYVDIICETYFNGNVFFPTEKTWRSLATKTPFIIQGPRHFLRRLHNLGFQTFERWWDESYDDDIGTYKLNSILRVIDEIGRIKNIQEIYFEMQEILEHNYQVFKNLTTNKIQEIICAS